VLAPSQDGLAEAPAGDYDSPILMTGFDIVSGLLLLGLIGAQIWLTRKVWRSASYERSQKVLQSKLIWLVPVVGAVLVFSLMPEEDDTYGQQKSKKELRG
jgi:hypothetical protein